MQSEFSGLIGIVGGIIDLGVGWVLLRYSYPIQGTGMGTMMALGGNSALAYFLMSLGFVVLITGAYALVGRMMNRRAIGFLMILYGVIMLILGVGMFSTLLPMIQGSTISGTLMIVVGVGMLYSGADMATG